MFVFAFVFSVFGIFVCWRLLFVCLFRFVVVLLDCLFVSVCFEKYLLLFVCCAVSFVFVGICVCICCCCFWCVSVCLQVLFLFAVFLCIYCGVCFVAFVVDCCCCCFFCCLCLCVVLRLFVCSIIAWLRVPFLIVVCVLFCALRGFLLSVF